MHHTKSSIRRDVRARRAAVPAGVRAAWDEAICAALGAIVTPGLVVCAYVPDEDEAGGPAMPAALAAHGARVLLPVSPASGPLEWAEFTGTDDLQPGRFGILVPSARPEGPERIADADLILTPAVAVDRSGNRLGRGRGYYDRSLTLARPRTRLMAVLDSEDVLDAVPAERHDWPVHGVITPAGVITF